MVSEEEFKQRQIELKRHYRTLRYVTHIILAYLIFIFFGPMLFDPIDVFVKPLYKLDFTIILLLPFLVWSNLNIYYKIVTIVLPRDGKVGLFLTLIIAWSNVLGLAWLFGFFH